MQLMNFDVKTTDWEQHLFPYYFDDDLEERLAQDALEPFTHSDEEQLFDDLLDELDIFEDDDLSALAASVPFRRIIQ